jgi:DNA-binding XRE family transcriptional regulator
MTYWAHEQFRQARHNLGLSQLALSRALDCGKRTIERCDADGCSKLMALAMERLADRWQPIESAPRDGECIIACHAGQKDSIGPVWWRRGRWTMEDGDRWNVDYLTHWKPLPEPLQ